MEEQKGKEPKRLTFKQSLIVTVCVFILHGIAMWYIDTKLLPYTNTITETRHNGRITRGWTRYYLHDHDSALRRWGGASLTGRIELRRLGLPKRAENLNVEVSYYVLSGNKFPVGLRLGKNNYPKDCWYYWTLYSATSHTLVFFVAFLTCGAGIYCHRNGVTSKWVTVYRFFCLAYIVFLLFIL